MRTKLCPGTYIKPDGGGSQQKGSRPHPPHREAGSREANGVLACLRELWPGAGTDEEEEFADMSEKELRFHISTPS